MVRLFCVGLTLILVTACTSPAWVESTRKKGAVDIESSFFQPSPKGGLSRNNPVTLALSEKAIQNASYAADFDAAIAKLRKPLLAGDWKAVAEELSRVPHKISPSVLLFISSHADLALNQNNDALCLFSRLTSKRDAFEWLEWAEKFAERDPTSVIAFYFKGDALARLGRWNQSLVAFNQALEHDPKHAPSLNARALVHAANNNWERALVDFLSAIAADPGFSDAYANLGSLYVLHNKRPDQALAAYNRALELSPNFLVALNGRASTNSVVGRWDTSKDDFLQIAERKGGCAPAIFETVEQNLYSLLDRRTDAASREVKRLSGISPGTSYESLRKTIESLERPVAMRLMGVLADAERFESDISSIRAALNGVQGQMSSHLFQIRTLDTQLDLVIPNSRVPLDFTRSYVLGYDRKKPLGRGWTLTLFMTLVHDRTGVVRVFDPDRGWLEFEPEKEGQYLSRNRHTSLTRNSDGSFLMQYENGRVFQFDKTGLLTLIRDHNHNTLTLSYGPNRRLHHAKTFDGHIISFAYDDAGRLESITAADGRTVDYSYNLQGNLSSVRDAFGRTTHYHYDAQNNLASIRYPSGGRRDFGIDEAGRLIRIQEAGYRLHVHYDETASETIFSDVLGRETRFTADGNGLIKHITDSRGNSLAFDQDANSKLLEFRDPRGHRTILRYDQGGNLLAVRDPLGRVMSFDYQPETRRISGITDAAGNTMRFRYDTRGNLIAVIHPDGSSEQYIFNRRGDVTSRKDRSERLTRFSYDQWGSVSKIVFPNNTSNDFTYDQRGNLRSARDKNGTIEFSFDASDRLRRVTYPGEGSVRYDYDSSGRVVRLSYPDGTLVNYQFDSNGRIESIRESDRLVAVYRYDSMGRVSHRELGNGIVSIYGYDPAGNLSELVHRNSGKIPLSRFSYQYDPAGNLIAVKTLAGNHRDAYDARNQVISEQASGYPPKVHQLDPVSNRVTDRSGNDTTRYDTNNPDHYVSVGNDLLRYDGIGNLIERTSPAGRVSYTYNFNNRLVKVETPEGEITYGYDVFGRRVSRTSSSGTTRYIYDGIRRIQEKDERGRVRVFYVNGTDRDETLMMKKNGKRYFYTHDGIGSMVSLTGENGEVVGTCTSDGYGFTKCTDRVRNIDPLLGQSLSPEPIWLAGRIDRDSSAGDNPNSRTNPWGHFSISAASGWDYYRDYILPDTLEVYWQYLLHPPHPQTFLGMRALALAGKTFWVIFKYYAKKWLISTAKGLTVQVLIPATSYDLLVNLIGRIGTPERKKAFLETYKPGHLTRLIDRTRQIDLTKLSVWEFFKETSRVQAQKTVQERVDEEPNESNNNAMSHQLPADEVEILRDMMDRWNKFSNREQHKKLLRMLEERYQESVTEQTKRSGQPVKQRDIDRHNLIQDPAKRTIESEGNTKTVRPEDFYVRDDVRRLRDKGVVEPLGPRPGGVSMKGIADAFVDRGSWDVQVLFGLLYPLEN